MTTTILGSLSLLIALLVAGTAAASDGLAAAGPDPACADKLGLYGQFVGDWTFDVVNYRPDGTKSEGKGEWNFFWALEGRAVQDVWITPPRGEREKTSQSAPSGYGTTVRFYDPKLDAWRITWIDPIHGNVQTFVAKKRGSEIVQDATGTDAGETFRWVFFEVQPASFRWRSESSPDGGKTWKKDQEMVVRRKLESRRAGLLEGRDPR